MSADIIKTVFKGKLGAFQLDVAFDAPMHGVTALFGPSGSGKTTILRCMAGLERLEGQLNVGDATWQDSVRGVFVPTHTREVGYVFQEASLFSHLSVRGNLVFGAQRATGSHALNLDGVAAMLGLRALLDRAPGSLSGGERQRVAVGRALLSQPRVLLMDEPLAGLDNTSKNEILPYLETLHERLSIPVFYVSHDISEVARLADRVVVLSGGRVASSGDAAQVLERLDLPGVVDRFEAGVILDATVARHDPRLHLTYVTHGEQELVLPKISVEEGQHIRLRILARDVALATQMPSGISVRNILTGKIVEVRETPDSAYAETLVDIGGANLRSRITRAATEDLKLSAGMPIYALIKSVSFER